MPIQIKAEIKSNTVLQGSYYRLELYAPEVCSQAMPGQFIHVQISELKDRILRRPFSICNVSEDGILTVIYKVIGAGTETLCNLPAGKQLDILGPLGKGFTVPSAGDSPVIVSGGYGSAATYLLARRSPEKGIILMGARSAGDLILADEYRKLGFDVRIATDDGSAGIKGFVTLLLDEVLEAEKNKKLRFYGCGPHGMLMVLGKILTSKGVEAELSLDHLMCCGVGACFACVVRVKADNEDGWRYARTCKEGPVFNAAEIYYEN